VIRLLIKLPVVLVLVLTAVWAGVLGLSRDADSIATGGLESLAQAYPEGEERADFLRDWGVLPPGLARLAMGLGGWASPLARAGLLVARLHSGVVVRLLPVFVLLLVSGVIAGLISRERMRDQEGYASPTAAGVAHVLVGSGVFWLGLFSLCPLPVSYASLHLAGMVLALGGSLYTANLPLRL
jgi:hypothetical protein